MIYNNNYNMQPCMMYTLYMIYYIFLLYFVAHLSTVPLLNHRFHQLSHENWNKNLWVLVDVIAGVDTSTNEKHVKKLVQDSDCPLGELSFRWLLLASSLPKRRDFVC